MPVLVVSIVQDVPPYTISDGYPASVRCLNTVGLIRNGIPPESRLLLKRAFKILFRSNLKQNPSYKKSKRRSRNVYGSRNFVEFH